jgi:hypothetical protein
MKARGDREQLEQVAIPFDGGRPARDEGLLKIEPNLRWRREILKHELACLKVTYPRSPSTPLKQIQEQIRG